MAVAPFNWDDAVQWDGPGAIAGSEEILSADRLDRARYAEFLTNYLAAEGKQRTMCSTSMPNGGRVKPGLSSAGIWS